MNDVREKMLHFYSNHKRMPGYKELMALMGYASKNSAYKLREKLIAERFIKKDKAGRLIPGDTFNDVKLLGVVEAGFPSSADEHLLDTMSLDEFLIDNREATYLLAVKGDSMIDAGICEGDLVVVERGATASAGDIVIAEVDGAWTMKYLRMKGKKLYLEAANKKYKSIVPKEDLVIAAVVRAVVRKY